MHDLEITWPSGQARFSPEDSPVHIGRSPDAAVIMTEPSVSRRHIEFVWTGSAWTASDESTHGSFDPIGVRLAPHWTVGTDTTIRLGGVEGAELRIELVTTRGDDFDPALGSPPPPVEVEQPAAPPGLDDLGAEPPPAAFDAPPPAYDPPVDEPAPAPAYDPPAAPPVEVPSAFDQAPSYDQGPGYDAPPIDPDSGGRSILGEAGAPDQGYQEQGYQEQGYQEPSYQNQDYGDQGYQEPSYQNQDYGDQGYQQDQSHGDPYAQAPYEAPPTGIQDIASTTAINDSTLQLSIDGNDYTFLPGTEVTVGRDPSCLVHLDERHSLVSRRHLKVTHRDGAWWIEDFSSKGTFVDGRQLSSPYKAEGAFIAQLGDDDAGTALRVITAGEHRAPRGRSLGLIIAIAVLAILAIVALALSLLGGGDDGTTTSADAASLSADGASADGASAAGADETSNASAPPTDANTAAADLVAAKQATVLLFANGIGFGSGFFVSDDLIVTNQHVALLADTLMVGVSREVDEPARFEYQAQTVALHPYLDIAVLQLSSDDRGNSLTAASGLVPARVGDSGSLTLGDPVYNTGFPSNLSQFSRDDMADVQLPPVGTTSGQAASFSIWPGCSNPDWELLIPIDAPLSVTCAPDGDIDRGIVHTTFSTSQGASGGPVFQGGEVIAVVFAGPIDEANAGRNITTASFRDWLTGVIAENS